MKKTEKAKALKHYIYPQLTIAGEVSTAILAGSGPETLLDRHDEMLDGNRQNKDGNGGMLSKKSVWDHKLP